MRFRNKRSFSKELDDKDVLRNFREHFHYPKNDSGQEIIYLCGNSLGLQPKKVVENVTKELSVWSEHAVLGQGSRWIQYHERLNEPSAKLVGALNSEVVVMNALTVNIHLLLLSFYKPSGDRKKILIEKNAFPSDLYAVESHAKLHGFNPRDSIIKLSPREGERIIHHEDIVKIVNKHSTEISLIYLGAVNYYTGQVFDIEKISKLARSNGIIVGFNLAHAAGNIPLELHKWNVDFSAWCTYKYLCAGPGSPSGVFINERHHNWDGPRLTGWWGHNKQSRFEMPSNFDPIISAEGWQISNAPILGMAPLIASMELYMMAGMKKISSKGKRLSDFAEYLIKTNLPQIKIITPRDRGCQLSLVITNGQKTYRYLTENGVICDWRDPDVIRIAAHPLFNKYSEIFEFVQILKAFHD